MNEPTTHAVAKELFSTLHPVFDYMRKAVFALEMDLAPQQMHVLKSIRVRAKTMSELAQCMRISPPTLSAMVSPLVKKGLVQRKRSQEDRRKILISLTPKGNTLLQKAYNAVLKEIAAQLQHSSVAERKAILRGLTLLQKSFSS